LFLIKNPEYAHPMKSTRILAAVAILIAASLFAPSVSHAQRVTTLIPTAVNDTLTNADTAWVYIYSGGTRATTASAIEPEGLSIQTVVTKVSGTVAGSFALEGTIDGTNWISIASDTFTNSATNTKSYNLRNSTGHLQFLQYRGVFITSGTTVVIPKLYYMRRH
jgi:heme/copper-type cytochrome/quinol oxidase subunit 2